MGCARLETIDIQSSQAASGSITPLANTCFLIRSAYSGAIQSNFFDGKSDGKSLLSILLLRFAVRRVGRRRESLQIAAYSQLMISGLGKSLSYSAGFLPCRDLTACNQVLILCASSRVYRLFCRAVLTLACGERPGLLRPCGSSQPTAVTLVIEVSDLEQTLDSSERAVRS